MGSRYHEQINTANPASYTAIDSLTFMFEFGLDARFSNFSNDLGSTQTNDVNFEYLAMRFQVNNWLGASLGLLPYSDMGYQVEVQDELENTGRVFTRYYGAGTVSNAYIGMAVEPLKNVSIGANLNYLFGKLNKNAEVYFLDDPGVYGIQQYTDFRLRDFGLDFGLQVTLPLKKNQELVFGAVFESSPEYTTVFSDITQKNLQVGQTLDQDTLFYAGADKSSIVMPLTFGGGLSYVIKNKLEVNADYYHQAWSNTEFNGEKSSFLKDLNKFALGAEWVPDKYSIRSYFNRVAYRAGLKYEESYLMFGDQQINEFGITFGVGIPIYRSKSTINVAGEFGKRGTKEDGLVLERYARLNMSVNLFDLWFVKRKFD